LIIGIDFLATPLATLPTLVNPELTDFKESDLFLRDFAIIYNSNKK
jgi:hypothetical protein